MSHGATAERSSLPLALALAAAFLFGPPAHADGRMGDTGRGESSGFHSQGFRHAPSHFNHVRPAPGAIMTAPRRFADPRFQNRMHGTMQGQVIRPAPQHFVPDHRMLRVAVNTSRFADARFENHARIAPGHVFQTLPPHHAVIFHHGDRFFFSHGVFFHAHGPRFIVVAPPLGLVLHAPFVHFTRVWFVGFPYPFFFAGGIYYLQSPQGYVVTQPPSGEPVVEEPAAASSDTGSGEVIEQPADEQVSQAPADQLYVYPSRGQSQQQLDADRKECRTWAVAQAGYDPNNASTGFQIGEKQLDYDRAISACLEGRGYTVR